MTEPTLFDIPVTDDPCRQGDDYAADRTHCRFPHVQTNTAYSYGCRCIGCRKSQSANRARWKLSPALCMTPGCDTPRRRVQGAKYCDEHATGRNYEPALVAITCVMCDRSVKVYKTKRYPICKACHEHCRGLVHSCLSHGVSPEMFLRWVRNPHCDLCDRRLYIGKGKSGAQGFSIDHDHAHCDGDKGCAACVRGLLCHRCNCMLGGYENLLSECGVDKVTNYLQTRR